ncbi:unnamed protein product [Ambrosiozyma monospora]|uniref:Unnamed protein product n=1 Tax=Ambrosiozyma monospora TaxID=43982 RepID=A0ACB5SYF5_AMBMO|nr:unnamed protein product [Ambrosiozyma monospora]
MSLLPSIHSPFGLEDPRPAHRITNDDMEDDSDARYAEVADDAKPIFLVLDTNFAIDHLKLLDKLYKLSPKYKNVYQIIIPLTVVNELDGLKNDSYKRLATQARNAIDWYFALFHNSDPIVIGQQLSQRLERNLRGDDAILDCCLYFKEKNPDHLIT